LVRVVQFVRIGTTRADTKKVNLIQISTNNVEKLMIGLKSNDGRTQQVGKRARDQE